ncbi:MAG: hypothetical protein DCC71_20590 [Proteobacteria bacterium]|nr:MAG: hypothetical protein DCC71_20590 [Pseudomonadota bacterium]
MRRSSFRSALRFGFALAAALALAGCSVPTFLVDADLDDDGVVTAADVSHATACLGTLLPAPSGAVDRGGCPIRSAPDASGCAAADVDGDRVVTPADVALVAGRLGLAVCNGSEALCERRFDEVAYATTHNAMAARFAPYDYSILISNQCSGVPTQLADGIRALMLDIHWYQPPEADAPDLYLCHSECDYGHQLLVDGLAEVRAFLDAHPAEVVSFIIETNGDTAPREAAIRDAFAASGLAPYALAQPRGAPWPTLGEMIAADQRLVVLTDDSTPHAGCLADGAPCPWYLYEWDGYAFETHFSYGQPDDLSCDDNRGEPGNDLFILNHFLTNNVGAPQFARQVNFDPLLSRRARDCWAVHGRIPNFPTVDFYEIGSVVRTANLLNFLWSQTGGAAP